VFCWHVTSCWTITSVDQGKFKYPSSDDVTITKASKAGHKHQFYKPILWCHFDLIGTYLCKQCEFNFDTWKMSSLISENATSYHHVNSFVIQTTCLEREGQRKPPEVGFCISSIGGHLYSSYSSSSSSAPYFWKRGDEESLDKQDACHVDLLVSNCFRVCFFCTKFLGDQSCCFASKSHLM
jgi:hypothetical protein